MKRHLAPTVSRNIRAEMTRLELERADMAKALDISTSNWDKLLADPESRISIGRLRVIAAKLGVDVATLLI